MIINNELNNKLNKYIMTQIEIKARKNANSQSKENNYDEITKLLLCEYVKQRIKEEGIGNLETAKKFANELIEEIFLSQRIQFTNKKYSKNRPNVQGSHDENLGIITIYRINQKYVDQIKKYLETGKGPLDKECKQYLSTVMHELRHAEQHTYIAELSTAEDYAMNFIKETDARLFEDFIRLEEVDIPTSALNFMSEIRYILGKSLYTKNVRGIDLHEMFSTIKSLSKYEFNIDEAIYMFASLSPMFHLTEDYSISSRILSEKVSATYEDVDGFITDCFMGKRCLALKRKFDEKYYRFLSISELEKEIEEWKKFKAVDKPTQRKENDSKLSKKDEILINLYNELERRKESKRNIDIGIGD